MRGMGGRGGHSALSRVRNGSAEVGASAFDKGADFIDHGLARFPPGPNVMDKPRVIGDQSPEQCGGHAALPQENFDLPPDMHIMTPFCLCRESTPERGATRLEQNKNKRAGEILHINRKYPIAVGCILVVQSCHG